MCVCVCICMHYKIRRYSKSYQFMILNHSARSVISSLSIVDHLFIFDSLKMTWSDVPLRSFHLFSRSFWIRSLVLGWLHISLKLMLQVKLIIILNYCKCYCLFPLEIKIGHHRFIPSRISALFPYLLHMHVVLSSNLDLLFHIVQHFLFIWRDSHDETSACTVQILKENPEKYTFYIDPKKCPISILRR